jgi:hypothetical protein
MHSKVLKSSPERDAVLRNCDERHVQNGSGDVLVVTVR